MMEKYPCLPLPFIAFDILGGPSANQRHDWLSTRTRAKPIIFSATLL
jgi:hypothetical protein